MRLRIIVLWKDGDSVFEQSDKLSSICVWWMQGPVASGDERYDTIVIEAASAACARQVIKAHQVTRLL